ncbi:MAG TPA: nitroreductase family deazaflavin-dependent oxidoreductase [Thermomicrobiaceae bacterium]|nr:nitroreductase family deazaflavin-dependent oxidoreductase [Thermomicrobiaceae bacterium]
MTSTTDTMLTRRPGTRRPAIARVMAVFNRVPKLILRSPLHRVMSGRVLLLSFTGRSSGRAYTTPLSYIVEDDDTLLIAGGAPWWRNLRHDATVGIRLRGRQRAARVEMIADDAEVARLLQVVLPRNPTLGRFVGLAVGPDGTVDPAGLARARSRGLTLARLHLESERRGA